MFNIKEVCLYNLLKILSPTLSNMTALTDVPNLSHADRQIIFEDVDIFFNYFLMDAFFKGMSTHS